MNTIVSVIYRVYVFVAQYFAEWVGSEKGQAVVSNINEWK